MRASATTRVLEAGPARALGANLRLGDVDEARELRVGDGAVAGHDLLQALGERGGIRDAGAGNALEQDRAGVVRHEEALHLLGRMGGPPPDDADRDARGRREVPDRGDRARTPRDRHPRARGGVDLLEVQHAMHVRAHAGRDARPHDRGERRREAPEARAVALRREALPVRHPTLGDEPVQQLPVQAVQTQPDDRSAGPAGARRAGRRVDVLDGRRSRRARRRGDIRGGGLGAPPAGEAAQGEQNGAGRPSPPSRRDHQWDAGAEGGFTGPPSRGWT